MSPSLSLPSAVEVDEEAAFSVAERSRKGEDDDNGSGDAGNDGRATRVGMRLCCCCRSATDPPAPRAPICAVARCMMLCSAKRSRGAKGTTTINEISFLLAFAFFEVCEARERQVFFSFRRQENFTLTFLSLVLSGLALWP